MSEFQERLKRRLEEIEREQGTTVVEHDPDLIPDFEESPRIDDDLQPILDNIDILDAYARWSGKNFTPSINGKRESIMIRCPNPAHNDENPSAWINLDKQTYCCGGCGMEGGDKYQIAAYHFGHPVPGYQTGAEFPELRKEMVEDCGRIVSRNSSGKYTVLPIIEEPEPVIESEPEPEPPHLRLVSEDEKIQPARNFLDWESLVSPDTFLDTVMRTITPLRVVPAEYIWMLAKQLVGLAVGHNVVLPDFPAPVYGNQLVLLYGQSGVRKSSCIRFMQQILREAVPYDTKNTAGSDGVLLIPSPGSPETLFKSFQQAKQDGAGNILGYHSVRGYLEVEELSDFIKKANRPGSSFKEEIMRLFDKTDQPLTHKTESKGLQEIAPPFFSCVATTQPKAIHAFLKKTDMFSGFLNRWDIAYGVQPENDENIIEPPDLTPCIDLLKQIHVWGTKQRTLSFTPEAKTRLNKFINTVIKPLKSVDDNDISTRYDLRIKTDLVLFATNERTEHITEAHIEKVEKQFPYIIRGSDCFVNDIAYNELDACIDKALEKIKGFWDRKGRGPEKREINMLLRGSGFPASIIGLTFKHMEQVGLIEMYQPDPKSKRQAIQKIK